MAPARDTRGSLCCLLAQCFTIALHYRVRMPEETADTPLSHPEPFGFAQGRLREGSAGKKTVVLQADSSLRSE